MSSYRIVKVFLMKKIILALCVLNTFIAVAMDAPLRRSSSSGRLHTLQPRRTKHASMGQNVLNALHLKMDKIEDCSDNVSALVTKRENPKRDLPPDSKKSADAPAPSHSQTWINLAGEKNRNDYIKMTRLAYDAIKNIKAVDDKAHQEFKSAIKNACYYYKAWISLEITKDPRTLDIMANAELKSLQNACDEKMATLLAQKK